MMKPLISYFLLLVFLGTANAVDPIEYGFVCPSEVQFFLDYSGSMTDCPLSGDDSCLPFGNFPIASDGCTETLEDQANAVEALRAEYAILLSNISYPTIEAFYFLYEWSNTVREVSIAPVPINTPKEIEDLIELPLCLGHTELCEVYELINETCHNSYVASLEVIFSDFHLAVPNHITKPCFDRIKELFEDIRTNCPGTFILCFQIGNDPLQFDPNSMCHRNVTADEFYNIIDNADDYADGFADIIVDICIEKEKEYIEKENAKIIYPTSTDPPAPIYYQPYEDPPVVISSDSKDGFWWWWILLAAIGALLCCLGGALAYKNKRKPELDIQHENMDLPCEDEVVVDDAQIHIRH